jgi:hypothetical protein
MLLQGQPNCQAAILEALQGHPCSASALIGLLSAVLPRLHPTDYDRIQFVYTLLQSLHAADDQGVLQRNSMTIDILRQLDVNTTLDLAGAAGLMALLAFHLAFLVTRGLRAQVIATVQVTESATTLTTV